MVSEVCFVVKLTGFPKEFRKTDCEKLAACTRSWGKTREQFSAVWRAASLKGVPISICYPAV
jgi:hypothetical protein